MMMLAKLITNKSIMPIFAIIDDQGDDCDYVTINLGHNCHNFDNGFDLEHMQDINPSNGHNGDECFRSMSSFF